MTSLPPRPRPVILVGRRETADLQELETRLYSAGYIVVSARNEHETVLKAHEQPPDAVLLDRTLTDRTHILTRSLRSDLNVSRAVPIFLTQDATPTRPESLEALRAGAWNIQGRPLDPDEMLLRLAVFLQAKLEVDRLTTECLIDRGSGLYNPHGFTQRAAELAALNNRQGNPAACAVFRPSDELPTRAAGDRVGRAFKAVGRLSDALGRTAASEFAVFAPATGDWAAARLVRRIRDNVIQEVGFVAEHGRRLTLRSAYSAALPSQKVEPHVLLERARAALQA